MNPSRDELILKYADPRKRDSLVVRIAKKAYRHERDSGARGISLDDITQELTATLIQLIDKYDPGKQVPMDAYVAQHLQWRARDAVDQSRVARDRDVPLINDEGIEAIPMHAASGTRRSASGARVAMPALGSKAASGVTMMKARECLKVMTERDKWIITAVIMGGVGQARAAEIFRVDQSTVSRVVKKFQVAMRKRA